MLKKLLTVILAVSFFAIPTPAFAKVMYQEKGVLTIAKDQVIDDDLFISGENVQIDGSILGSVFVAGGKVDISGPIKGDLVVGAGEVRISGNITGDVYAGTGRLDLINADIAGNVISGAGEISLDKDTKVGGSMIIGSGTVTNEGAIGRNLFVGSGQIYQDGKVGKEARLGGGEISLGSKAMIAGDLIYALGEDGTQLSQAETASIGGTTSRYTPPVDAKKEMQQKREYLNKFGSVAKNGWLMVSFLGSLVLGILMLKLMPKNMLLLSTQLKSNIMSSLGIGLLMVVLAGPTLLIVAMTIIGLPVAGVSLLTLCLAIHLAKLVASYALGRMMVSQFNFNKWGAVATLALGLATFYLLKSLPVFGWMVSMLFTWAGLGAIWSYIRSHRTSL